MHESIDLRLGPSRALCVALAVAHAVALAAIWRALPVALAAPASLLVVWSAVDTLRRHGLRTGADAVVGVAVRGNEVHLQRRDGRVHHGPVHPDSMVLPWLVIVRIRIPGRKGVQSALVARDCTAPGGHRRLRVFLRWGRFGRQD